MTVSRHDRPERDRRTSPNRRGGLDRRVGDRRLDSAPPGGERRQGAERRGPARPPPPPGRRPPAPARDPPPPGVLAGREVRPRAGLPAPSPGGPAPLHGT